MVWAAIGLSCVAIALLVRERMRSHRSDLEFRSVLDESPASLVVFDDTTVLYANQRVIDVVGSGPAGSVVGRPLVEVLSVETAQLARDGYHYVSRTGERYSVKDFPVTARNGTVVRCDLTITPTTFGGIAAAQCAFVPVDEKHAALVALQATEERFKRFFDEMPVPMYRTRLDGTIVYANRALAAMLGITDPGELVGVNATEFYADPDERGRLAAIQVQAGLLEDQISVLNTRDGRVIWVRDSSHTTAENGDEIFEGALINVTQEQIFNQELQRRATQQQALAEIASSALRESDAGNLLGEAVERICEVLGAQCALVVREHEDLGLIATSVAYRVDSVRDRERLLRYLRGQATETPAGVEPVALDAAAEPGGRPLQGVKISLAGPREDFGVIAVGGLDFVPSGEDLAFLTATAATLGSALSRSRSRARLAQLMRSKDEFVASVSHELRTPLTVVAGLALELEQGWRQFSPHEMEEFISLIADQSREMGDLIEDLLVAARADIGKVPIYAANVALRECVEQVVGACSLADRARIVVNGDAVTGHVDPVRCRQVIRNLVSNAIRYGGPHIVVSVGESDGQAKISVFDDGSGIAERDREKVFTAYERGEEAGSGVPGSVGLGLTVSRKLTELMNGSIAYRYEGGSHFEVLLPLAAATATTG